MINLATTPQLLAMLTPPNVAEYVALIPGAILCLAALLVIILDVFHTHETSREYLSYVSALAFAVTGFACIALWNHPLERPAFHGMLYLDRFSLFFGALVSVGGLLTSLLSPSYLKLIHMDRSEFYVLTLFSGAGMVFMVASADLLSLFISLEVMSIPLYCLAAFVREDRKSAESGLKYFILGAFSTALTLYGVALIYGITGTTNLEAISVIIRSFSPDGNLAAYTASNSILVIGAFLVFAGFLFKAAIAPFHVWTPDVYTGTPTPGTGFMATGVKAASFAVLLRLALTSFDANMLRSGAFGVGWVDVLFYFAAFSVVIGNFAAICQSNVKRMLAYSSIAHAGYITVGLTAASMQPDFFLLNDATLFYLFAYTFTTIGAFGVLAYIAKESGKPIETYEDLKGVGLQHPFVGLMMAVFMFSSAGIPPTAGFLAKFYVFRGAVDVAVMTGQYMFIGLAILAVLSSICGVYYYLKVLVSMYMNERSDDVVVIGGAGSKLAIIVCAITVLASGIVPQTAIDWSREAILGMVGPANVARARAVGVAEMRERRHKENLERIKELETAYNTADEMTAPGSQAGTLEPIHVERDAHGRPVEVFQPRQPTDHIMAPQPAGVLPGHPVIHEEAVPLDQPGVHYIKLDPNKGDINEQLMKVMQQIQREHGGEAPTEAEPTPAAEEPAPEAKPSRQKNIKPKKHTKKSTNKAVDKKGSKEHK